MDLGVNVLRNDALSALAIAAATDCSFIRVNVLSGAAWTDQGYIEGRSPKLLYRDRLRCDITIMADVKSTSPFLLDLLTSFNLHESWFIVQVQTDHINGSRNGSPCSIDNTTVKQCLSFRARPPIISVLELHLIM